MNPALLLDTHAWVWWLRGPAGGSLLSTRETAALDALPFGQRPALCDTSLWEVAMLVDLGRLQLDRPLIDWLELACSAVEVLPVTVAVAAAVAALPASFHRDPEDQLIVATGCRCSPTTARFSGLVWSRSGRQRLCRHPESRPRHYPGCEDLSLLSRCAFIFIFHLENPHKALASIHQLLSESREWPRPQQVAAFAAIKVMLRELKEYLEEEQPPGWGSIGEKLASLTFYIDALFGMNEDNGHDAHPHHVWALGDLDTMESKIPVRS